MGSPFSSVERKLTPALAPANRRRARPRRTLDFGPMTTRGRSPLESNPTRVGSDSRSVEEDVDAENADRTSVPRAPDRDAGYRSGCRGWRRLHANRTEGRSSAPSDVANTGGGDGATVSRA